MSDKVLYRALPSTINDKTYCKLEEWINKLPKKYNKKDIWFKFSHSSGIGLSITARCGDQECDITDYASW